jgi:putrescine---pyruvate transaminase
MAEPDPIKNLWDSSALKAANGQHLWQPMAHPGAVAKAPPDIIARGEGAWVWDIDGHKLLDGVGGLWSCNLGHSNRAVRDAIVAQLDELPFYNVFRGTTHPRAIEISEKLVATMAPDGVGAVMFSNGGSDAVEGALKVARQYHKLKGQGDRTKFVSLKQGYHGVHFAGMSVNGNTNFRRPYEPLLPGCSHVDTPWLYHNPYTQDLHRLGETCAELLEREIVFQGPDTVAAFIAEPVQGAGGVIVPPPNYWPLVRAVCDKYGVLLIADEVVTGFGRTGSLFGTRHWGVKADMWCLAKGLTTGYIPMGATAISEGIAKVFKNDTTGAASVTHGYTYSAHPVAAAAALATMAEVERLDVAGNAARVGEPMQARLRKLVDSCGFVGDVRGVGLMTGIEMLSDKAKRVPMARTNDIPARVAKAAYRRGLMVRISGPNMILSPALTLTEAEANLLCEVLEESFTAVESGKE